MPRSHKGKKKNCHEKAKSGSGVRHVRTKSNREGKEKGNKTACKEEGTC